MLTFTENARISTWILDRKLGEGGMGEVWKGHVELVPQKLVAIKIIRPQFAADPEFRARFQSEAKIMASLTNAPIIPLENFFEESGYLVLVMPFKEGETLDKHIARYPAGLPLPDIQRISGNVLTALEAAHTKGILHRDLKPQNILLTPAGEAFLMDFGIAKDISSNAPGTTGTGMIIGTAEYMSPEHIRGGTATDGRSDIYGFGCVLYQMATGQLPFRPSTPGLSGQMEILRLHLDVPPVNPSQLNPAIAPALEAAILRALAKDPAHRFRDCREFRDALTSLSTGSSYSPTTPQRGLDQPRPDSFTVPQEEIRRPGPTGPSAPEPKPLPFAKYIGLAAALSLSAAGGWWLVHDLDQHPQHKEEKKKKEDIPIAPPPSGKKPGQDFKENLPTAPLTPPPPVPKPTPSPQAEADYNKAKKIEETAVQSSDYCLALVEARKAAAADPGNPKYSAFLKTLENSCP